MSCITFEYISLLNVFKVSPFLNMEIYGLQFPSDAAMTNFDLLRCARNLNIPNFRGVYMRDCLPKRPHQVECRIMNLNRQSKGFS